MLWSEAASFLSPKHSLYISTGMFFTYEFNTCAVSQIGVSSIVCLVYIILRKNEEKQISVKANNQGIYSKE